ncbi:MAG: glycerophosphodiester phosphodiesterase [Acidimicrobiia bacterium]|nr:glycerophosphodiester phosphodiesterase [Acidimicrobiia bacterium]MCY4435591.1 glycerophosphodiester phosphodiesterase [bacterium]
MRVIAHRGASAAERENTLEAFRAAVRLNADGVELDVRRTANDVLVVHHDAHLPDGRAIVELQDDELPDWVPTLAEVMEVCRDPAVDREFVINIEIKSAPGDPDYDAEHQVSAAVAGLVLGWGIGEVGNDVIVSSFDMEALDRIRAIDPGIPTAYLTFEVLAPDLLVGRVVAAGHSAIHPYFASTSRALIDAAHAAGLEVNVWTVNDPDQIAQLAALGADAVITDVPDVAREALGKI